MDELLNGAQVPQGPGPETLQRIAGSIAASLRPVRPLPPQWVLSGGVALGCVSVALGGSTGLGFFGLARMTLLERLFVFPALGLLVLATAREMVSAMVPGSRRRLSSSALLTIASLGLASVLALCFRDYHTTRFIHSGLVCLAIGLLHATVAGLLGWLVLRRGFAVEPRSAGLAAGTLGGLAGVAMLELHCPNFEAPHVLVWHLAVLLLSSGLGALCSWIATSNSAGRVNRSKAR
jgi:hypothetical protein